MFTEPKVILTKDLSQRGYVSFYLNGKRCREYNGKKLNQDLNPNYCTTYADRLRHFKKLAYEFTKALEGGWAPMIENEIKKTKPLPSLQAALETILRDKLSSDLSKAYKNDLSKVVEQFTQFLPKEQIQQSISEVNHLDIERFLSQFSSSATYYMNKRRALNVFFSELHRTKLLIDNPVQTSLKKKSKATLHKIYSQQQLKDVLEYLSLHYPNLHLCCLLAYGCFLRPHQEARLLCVRHINIDCSKIVLAGSENKSKRIRVVNVPLYVQSLLKTRIEGLEDSNTYLMSKSITPFNVSYLNTQWSRAKKKMIDAGLIEKDQTIYSFRHTAAVNVYKKTKDLHILQQLLQHSNMIVTLNYLRGLGEISDDRLRDVLPEL
ncbi:site-specific integrase [Pedobacter heparinus]|uniref:tyrosine-type recombinase/integrase n=1 Tax=Pedobacter heparinus TaxID=984 RepID=UPI00292E6E55|nr:site-specific integrase [Pedobacter heparinus]